MEIHFEFKEPKQISYCPAFQDGRLENGDSPDFTRRFFSFLRFERGLPAHCSSSYKQCYENVISTVNLLSELGFLINREKSMLEPAKSCKFLGFIFDTELFAISIPSDKRSHLLELVNSTLAKKSCKIRFFASVIGSLISICPAVQYGWGAVCGKHRTNGFWSKEEKMSHINYLKLLAAFYGLKCFASQLSNVDILLRMDNSTAIAYINRMGSIKFSHLSDLTRKIWIWCENRNIFIFASYIPSAQNVEADAESRVVSDETEWTLGQVFFEKIESYFGQFDIDLFATHKAEGVLVVPWWPTQPWFPLLQRMTVDQSICFKPDSNLLSSPFKESHPNWQKISLVAVKLSARPS
ncbi:uncharacterized protein [Cardiocondyla obscurior]|uniref:uncharacterized protein n=1 Tax=Cardiocondyla obscurior TaxID=286306 RepID=UPI0039658890